MLDGTFYRGAVKLHPGVLPGVFDIGKVDIHLTGKDQKAFAGTQVKTMFFTAVVGVEQRSLARDDVVKQVMAALCRPKGMARLAHLTSVLEEHEVDIVCP